MFSDVADDFVGGDFEHVEVDSLSEGSALTYDDDVALLYGEGGRAMHGDVSMSLLVSVVFGHVVEIVAPDDDGSLHFG